ncbi:MAG: Ig-like domain-containing protein, partial [Chitinophagaceae bacterium]
MKRLILLLLLLLFLIQQIVVLPGCATIIPPEGGPRDSLPPVLLKANPADSSLNFDDKTIVFSFDEYVDADNYQQEMIISPIPSNMPTVTRKLQTVTVKLRDTLEPNTTYTINFGNAIKDVNEANIMRDFTYTFSTGSYFDSLEFRGNVLVAETGEVDTTLTVMLHRTNIDSAVIKEKPRYIAKTDGRGDFQFKNLPPDTFYV